MNENKASAKAKAKASGGIGFCGLLTIVFIVLKLIGIIKWNWFWVLSPLWLPTAMVGLILFIVFVVLICMSNGDNDDDDVDNDD